MDSVRKTGKRGWRVRLSCGIRRAKHTQQSETGKKGPGGSHEAVYLPTAPETAWMGSMILRIGRPPTSSSGK